jgi:hypothetical protein
LNHLQTKPPRRVPIGALAGGSRRESDEPPSRRHAAVLARVGGKFQIRKTNKHNTFCFLPRPSSRAMRLAPISGFESFKFENKQTHCVFVAHDEARARRARRNPKMRLAPLVLVIILPQCVLAATPMSFVNFPAAVGFRAAAADLENLHDEEEGGEAAPIGLSDSGVPLLIFLTLRRTLSLLHLQVGRSRRRAHEKPSRPPSTAMSRPPSTSTS